jgi:hypothetical protein
VASPGPGIYHPRRYYLLKSQVPEAEDSGLREVWWAKQAATPAVAIPANFPHQAALAAIRYTTWHDIDGATVDELIVAGLPRQTAQAVIKLRGEKMGYTKSNGEWADTDPVVLSASSSKTATASGAWVEIGDKGTLRLLLDVTVDGGGTLDITVETADDATGTNTRTLSTFAQVSAVGTEKKSFTGCDRFARIDYTIVTGPFTFEVSGEAV